MGLFGNHKSKSIVTSSDSIVTGDFNSSQNSGYVGVNRLTSRSGIISLNKIYSERSAGRWLLFPGIIANLELWLDADQLTGYVEGADIITWSDLSGNGRHFTGVTVPDYRNTIVNSKPVARFSNTESLATTPLNLGTSYTYFVVYKRNSDSDQVILGHNGGFNLFQMYAGNWRIQDEIMLAYDTAADIGEFHSYCLVRDAGTATHYTDGISRGTTSPNVTAFLTYLSTYNGSALPIDGDIAEVIVYSRALLTDERQQIESYLAAKYGL